MKEHTNSRTRIAYFINTEQVIKVTLHRLKQFQDSVKVSTVSISIHWYNTAKPQLHTRLVNAI